MIWRQRKSVGELLGVLLCVPVSSFAGTGSDAGEDEVNEPTRNERIRALRHARGWTQEQAAEAVADAVCAATNRGRPTGIDAQWVSRLERGELRWPNADYRAALRAVYGAATDAELGLSGMRSQAQDSAHAPTEVERCELTPTRIAEAVGNNDILTNSLAEALTAAAGEAADFGAWAEQMHRGTIAIERLHQRTRQLAGDCLTQPPTVVMAQARPLSRDVFALAREHHKPAQARDLYVIATYLCSMMAWLAGDLGALDAADLQARTAWACAELAEDAESSAWALSAQAKIAFQRKNFRKTVELARRGLRYDAPGTSQLMLRCQEADALSLLGAMHEATESIRRADTEAERVREADNIGGLLSCGPARHANYAAGVHLLAGQTDLALAEADRALNELMANSTYGFGTVAQLHLTRTTAYIQAGQIDGATEAVRPVLSLPPEQRLSTLTERLRPLASVLKRPALRGSAVARSLSTEIVDYCADAVSPSRHELTTGTGE